MMINSSTRRSLILSSREDKERKKASACGVSAHSRVLKETLNRKKVVVFVKKVEKKEIFVVSVCRHINTPLRGNRREATTSTTQQNDERSKKVDSSVGQSSGGESSRGDENERGDFVARNRRK